MRTGTQLGDVGNRNRPERRAQLAIGQLPDQEVHRRRPDEAGHEQVARPLVEVVGRAHLLQDAIAHHRQPVSSVIASV